MAQGPPYPELLSSGDFTRGEGSLESKLRAPGALRTEVPPAALLLPGRPTLSALGSAHGLSLWDPGRQPLATREKLWRSQRPPAQTEKALLGVKTDRG